MTDVTLVTGASGFIGTYVVQRLLEDEIPVRVLVRHPEGLPISVRRRVAVVVGDLRDTAAIAKAVDGVHSVLHLGAFARVWSRDRNVFRDVNVRAVAAMLDEATREGVVRFVHVSTILTRPPFRPAPLNGVAQRLTPYEETKLDGERLVEAYARRRHAVIVHPTRVYGPGPLTDANGVTKVIALYLQGRLRVRLEDADVLSSYVHAADVAQGIIQAARHGSTGSHYILGGEDRSFRELLELTTELSGVRHRVVAIPPRVAVGVARAAKWWGTAWGHVRLTPAWIRVFLEDRRADSEAARRALGYRPRSLRQGLAETVAWLRQSRGRSAA